MFVQWVWPSKSILLFLKCLGQKEFALPQFALEVAISTWAEMMKCTKEGLEQRGSADLSMVSEMLRALIAKLGKVLIPG